MTWRTVPASAAILATFLLLPATGWSAVAQEGNTFFPKTGPELSEAAGIISAAGQNDGSYQATVQLEARTYSIANTVVFSSLAAPTVTGPSSGGRAIVTNSGAPGTLLRLTARTTSASSGISNVDFTLKGAMPNAIATLDLQRGSQLRDSLVTVPSATPKATAIRLSPALGTASTSLPAVIQRVRVQSNAPDAPAVRATNGSQILDSTITGGAPALEILGDGSGADLGNVTVDATTIKSTGTNTAIPVVAVRGGGNHVRAVLWSTSVDGTVTGASQLIDIDGPTSASGSVDAELGQVSLRGVGTTGSTGVNVRPGVGAAKLTVKIRGLLSLGSVNAIDCLGSATDANATTEVQIAGIYRVGANVVGSKCNLSEVNRREGALAWRNEAAGDLHPVWNSPLVDVLPNASLPAGVGQHDLAGGARFVQVGSGSPGDIGALEYQLTRPEAVSANFTTLGNRGLTALIGTGSDPDEQEGARLVFRWSLPDGSSVDGQAALYRFGSAQPQQVTLSVIDVTGATESKTVVVTPNVRLDEAATDVNVAPPVDPGPVDPVPVPEEPAPTGPTFVRIDPVIPKIPTIPTGTVSDPKPDPSLKQDFPPILKSVRARSRRILTNRTSQPSYASARKGEAELLIQTFRESEMSLEVSTVIEGEGLTVGLPVAKIDLKEFTGRKTLRIGAKIGKKKLKPGLYQMTVAATPRPGAVPERISFFVRVVRAR